MPNTCPDKAVTEFMDDRECLIALASRIVESRAVAEEIVQESWLRWQGQRYEASDAKPIFRRIVSNLAKDWRRSRTVEYSVLSEVERLYSSAPCTETAVIARAELLIAIKTLRRLPKRHVLAFRMRTIENKTYSEIGQHLNLSLSHARNLVERVIVEVILALDK